MKEKKELTKKFWWTMLVICVVLVALIGAGFAVYANSKRPVIYEEETGGNIVLNYTDDITGLKLDKVIPTADAVGMKDDVNYFDFSVEVTLDNATFVDYEISVIKKSKSSIADEDIRIYLEQEQSGSYVKVFGPETFVPIKEVTKKGSPVGSMVLYHVKRTKSLTDRYRLRIWLSDKSVVTNGTYELEVNVNGISE